ncbi:MULTISPECIES: class I SAM-dependent methyltransferase [unclassified Crossiella]|uniref:class I SAM-dependent methyltransferase n=1 Tax=unclassified Crossiella TaxID=2620835 RepID=UPI001FFF405C|nr:MULTISPECIES: class I SAM-dependent methyltransferase [unclassified Crossiella]MCK2237149.1 class I SAM-dependent methyltransferase [Crossiella sp. S99.2]MCK2250817.1 class I SAM-dependent methyltransferase [Crossiella sp. S99.1]
MSWMTDRPLNQFALPRGWRGRLAGWVMARTNGTEMAEVLGELGPVRGRAVLEVGFGPGLLSKALTGADARVTGVDPSEVMLRQARRRAPGARLRLGSAQRTGGADGEFEVVVSMNNLPMWPDLDAALDELHRVTRPGGRLVLAWHGGTEPTRRTLGMLLPAAAAERVLAGLRARFASAELTRTKHCEIFVGTR